MPDQIRLLVSRAHTLVDAQGALTDAKTLEQLHDFIAGFAQFVRTARGPA